MNLLRKKNPAHISFKKLNKQNNNNKDLIKEEDTQTWKKTPMLMD